MKKRLYAVLTVLAVWVLLKGTLVYIDQRHRMAESEQVFQCMREHGGHFVASCSPSNW